MTTDNQISRDAFRTFMGSFGSSVTVITTLDCEGTPRALTATAFTSLSADPPLCLVCIRRGSQALSALTEHGKFAVNILGSHQAELSSRFASSADDRFAGVDWQHGEVTNCPRLPDVLAFAECEVQEAVPGGDHDIVIGRLVSTEVRDGGPLLYFRGQYRQLGQENEL